VHLLGFAYRRGHRRRVATTHEGAVLDDFRIDYGLCMYCGICIEVCPFDALEWRPEYDYPAESRAALVHDRESLTAWRESK